MAGIAAFLALALGLVPGVAGAAEPVTRWHVPVLMYHRIAPDSDLRRSIPDLVVRPRVFAAHMRALHDAGWRTITAADLATAMKARVAIPRGTVVITFDDGTQDVYANAWPIMQRYGYVGTFYVITSKLYRSNRPTSYSMSRAQVAELALSGNEIGNHTVAHACLSGTSYEFDHDAIERGARHIWRYTGVRPITLAWPKGCFDATAIEAARDARMYLAFTTYPGCRQTVGARLVSPRIRVSRWTTAAELLRRVAPCR